MNLSPPLGNPPLEKKTAVVVGPVDSVDIPLEIRPYTLVGIGGTARVRTIKSIFYRLKRLGFKHVTLLNINTTDLIGILLGGDIIGTEKDMTEAWQTFVGPGVFRKFVPGKRVEKQLTSCGYPVKTYSILEGTRGTCRHFK